MKKNLRIKIFRSVGNDAWYNDDASFKSKVSLILAIFGVQIHTTCMIQNPHIAINSYS
jgi:hypothetical protein